MKNRTFSPVLALMGALVMALVVGVFSASPFGERDVAYAQAAGASDLSNLVLKSGSRDIDLDDGFAFGDYRYGETTPIRVPNLPSSLRLTATANVPGSPVKVYSSTDDNAFAASTASGDKMDAIDGTSPMITRRSASSVPISIDTNHIAIEVASLAEPPTYSVYVITINRLSSDVLGNADMTGLLVTDTTDTTTSVSYSPSVKKDVLSYSVRVPTGRASVTLTPGLDDETGATFAITSSKGAGKVSVNAIVAEARDVALDEGVNVITIKVTAANLVATKTYTLTVTKAASNASDDANLSALRVGGESVSLTGFDGTAHEEAGIDHQTGVANGVSSIAISATPNDSDAMVIIRTGIDISANATTEALSGAGNVDADGTVNLSVGTNDIAIVVIPENAEADDTRVYLLRVERAAAGASGNADMTGLLVTDTTDTTTSVSYSPSVKKDVLSYSVRVPTGRASVTLTPGLDDETGATFAITSSKGAGKVSVNAIVAEARDVALDEGVNVITIKVTAANLVATKTYTLTVTKAASNASDDANLSALMVGGESVSLTGFDGTAHEEAGIDHQTGVANGVSSIAISATPNDSDAMVIIRTGIDISANATTEALSGAGNVDADGTVNLSVGTNDIAIVVIPENAEADDTRVYLLRVERAAAGASGNADMTGLLVTDTTDTTTSVSYSPSVKKDVLSYSVRVPTGRASVTLTPGLDDETGATFAITSSKGAGKVSVNAIVAEARDVALDEGVNVITIKVTAANLVATKTYTLTVTKAASNASDDANLSALMVGGESVSLTGFDGTAHEEAGIDHQTGVANGVSSIAISATPNHSDAMVVIRTGVDISANATTTALLDADAGTADADGTVNLSVGPNDIAIVVTPENAELVDTKVYLLRIERASANDSDDAKLVSLTLSRITLSPVFDKDIKMYSVDVLDNIVATTVTATAAASLEDGTGAATSVVISSDRDDEIGPNVDTTPLTADPNPPNVARHTIDLSAGVNVITIVVTAEDYETMETYTVRVLRGVSDNATLSSLSLMDSDGMAIALMDMDGMTAEFMADIDMYYADVDAGVDMIEVMATAMDSDATVSGDGAVSLDVGENTITVTVTAEDGTTMMTYTVMVTREAAPVEGDLLDKYDADESGHIDLSEVNTAIDHYFYGDLTLDQVNDVIDLYFS